MRNEVTLVISLKQVLASQKLVSEIVQNYAKIVSNDAKILSNCDKIVNNYAKMLLNYVILKMAHERRSSCKL